MTRQNDQDVVTRRTFLVQLATVGAGAGMLSGCACMTSSGGGHGARSANHIGLQLYTVRDLMEKDFAGTLERVAQIGYTNMEFAGYFNHSPVQVRAMLDRLNLVSTSAHIGAQLMQKDAAAEIASAKTIGQEYITIPSYSYPKDARFDAWKKAAAEFNRWGAMCRDTGIKLAYHNHAPEFVAVAGGPTGYDVLLRETDASLVDFEMDIYWTRFADQDPMAWFAKFPGRFTMWHMKDLQVTNGTKGMAPVGSGTIDFKTILTHTTEAGLKHMFVEHDTAAAYPGGSLASIQASITNLRVMLA
ncbi:MAG: Xylose isomerase protein barrel [Gemmatimonadetes bacterium]|nr:Xylose isomerase protein barrel [Gemmatimonadota bacterium]